MALAVGPDDMRVSVLGAGTMGRGIAQVAATAGHDVTLRDVEADLVEAGLDGIRATLERGVDLEKVAPAERDAALARLETTTALSEAVADADVVVEAVPERLDLKREVFADVEAHAPADALLATNTSSLSVTAIASALATPEGFVGLHFFNPVHLMALVEVVVGERTAAATRERAVGFVEGLGKTPVVVEDSPGFVTSRLGVSLGVEAMRLVQEGVASPRDVDEAMRLGYNHPMGPLELGDVVGLDVRLDILEYLRDELGERFRPPPILRRKVEAGKLGRKVGEGFYVWQDGEIVGVSGGGGGS